MTSLILILTQKEKSMDTSTPSSPKAGLNTLKQLSILENSWEKLKIWRAPNISGKR